QAVGGTIVLKLNHSLRMNARCTWRPMEGLQPIPNTAISSAFSPSHMEGSIKAGVHCCSQWVAPLKHHPDIRANQGGESVRSHATIAAQVLVMRGPYGCHIFASVFWPRHTEYSSETIDMTVHWRNRERGIQ